MLTDRQAEVLKAVRNYIDKNGRGPTLEEIGARVGMSSTLSVRRHLDILTNKGFINPRGYGIPRDISLTKRGRDARLFDAVA